VLLALLLPLTATAAEVEIYSAKAAPSIDPAKPATLGKRGTNPRIQKSVGILANAEANGVRIEGFAKGILALLELPSSAASNLPQFVVRAGTR